MSIPTEPKRGRGRPKKVVNIQDEKLADLETISKQKKRIDYLNSAAIKLHKNSVHLAKKVDEYFEKNSKANEHIAELEMQIVKAEKALQQSIDSINMLEVEVDKQDKIIKLFAELLFLTCGDKHGK